jgi:O-antigen ligase
MQFLFGYEQYLQFHDTRGSSVMQRIELWQASINIISKNLFFGVGTGDIPDAFKLELKEMESKLQDSSLRSHNQFLSITVGFGLMGLAAFLFILIYPPYHTKKFQDKRYLLFFFIFMLSLLNEDTIESQAGVTFFAFFNSLLIFGLSSQNKETL